jgi:hypothetical protein
MASTLAKVLCTAQIKQQGQDLRQNHPSTHYDIRTGGWNVTPIASFLDQDTERLEIAAHGHDQICVGDVCPSDEPWLIPCNAKPFSFQHLVHDRHDHCVRLNTINSSQSVAWKAVCRVVLVKPLETRRNTSRIRLELWR